MPPSSLATKLQTALASRESRLIRRRLPQPTDTLIDFTSNDYLSLTQSPILRSLFLSKLTSAPSILGAGGSRLLVYGDAHAALEARLARFFRAPDALLFNSGFDANVSLFTCIPQPGDVVIYDEFIHASVHDGLRASRATASYAFTHNDLFSLRRSLEHAKRSNAKGTSSVFVAVESVYSMEGTLAPLKEIVEMVEGLFPEGNGYVIVDEAHTIGVYGPQGRGVVAMLGLEERVLVRLCTFGKALAGTGAVLLVNGLIKDYLVNYARPLIFTTALSYANMISAECSFDLLENGTADVLAAQLLDLSKHFLTLLLEKIRTDRVTLPSHLMSRPVIPTAIFPIMTTQPRSLSAFLWRRGMNARPITWPTVPKGMDRVRVCLHAGNTKEEVEKLVDAIVAWSEITERVKL